MTDRFPWFPFYVAEWRLSRSVRAMTLEQRGGYMELLAVAWDDGIAEPSLPPDDASLAKLSEMGPKRWAKAGAAIRACFAEREGRLYNKFLSKVWEIQRAKYALRSQAGKLGGIAKAKRLANGKHCQESANGFAGQTQKLDRTNSSSGAALGALTDGALAAVLRRR